MNFLKFLGPFYDDVIYRDDSYLWSGEKLKIKAKDLKFFKRNIQTKEDLLSSDSVMIKGKY